MVDEKGENGNAQRMERWESVGGDSSSSGERKGGKEGRTD